MSIKVEKPAEASPSTVEWVNQILGGSIGTEATRDGVRYLLRPTARTPELLIPLQPGAVAASALRRFHDSRSLTKRAINLASQVIGRSNLLQFSSGDVATITNFALVTHLAKQLGEPQLLAAIILGPQRRNRKPVLQLIRPDGVVVGFAKVGWSPLTNQLVQNEAAVLRKIEHTLPGDITAPRVLHTETNLDGGRSVTVVSAVDNGPFPRRSEPLQSDVVTRLASSAPGGSHKISDLTYLQTWNTSEPLSSHLSQVMERHGETELRVGLWHGDLTPWNTSTTKTRMAVWDWEFAGFDRPVGFDLLHDRFENKRRDPAWSTMQALNHVEKCASNTLAPITPHADAVVDLYLCELLHREVMLSGQRWQAKDLEQAAPAINAVLQRRLR